jgi:hypothetical protein
MHISWRPNSSCDSGANTISYTVFAMVLDVTMDSKTDGLKFKFWEFFKTVKLENQMVNQKNWAVYYRKPISKPKKLVA